MHSHLCSSQEDTNNSAQPEDTSTSQQNVHTQDETTQSDSNPLPNATRKNALSLPQQLLSQLTSFLQQAQNPTTASFTLTEIVPTDTMEDDHLSAASMPVQSSLLPSTQTPGIHTSILAIPPRPSTTIVGQLTPSLLQLTLPSIFSKIEDEIAKGEYIDFTTFLLKSMFGASESQSRTLTLQLSPSGENYSIRPQATPANRKTTLFAAWMEAWNVYLSVRVALDPSCVPYLIAYQRIITSANSSHPLHSWINYDMKFRTKAASEPTLRWDIRELSLWLECFPGTPVHTTSWPCSHCGSTTHFPSNCHFRPPTSQTSGGQQPALVNSQQ